MSIHADPPPSIVLEPHGASYATANQLGKGGFAICFKAEKLDGHRPTGQIVALKIVRSKMEPAKLAQKFITELQIHSKLSHPNIVGFNKAFSFEASTYVVLELCSSGSLADLLKRRKCVTMPEIRKFMIQVCGAVKYLHTRSIVHRDLKTGNLFLDEHMNIKVGDFGLAALLVSGKDMDAKRRTTMCGTPNYLAPEILEKGKGHNEKVDLWAIGIISYTLAVGKAPFHAASKEEIYKKLKAGEYSWPELSSITNDISADLRDLVSKLLVPEELRPCPDKIVAHPFFRMAFVPQKMSSVQMTKTPSWPVQLPGPDVIQRGYSDSWWSVCKQSGVGEYAPGKCFQLNDGQRIRSIVKDIERELAAGRQPVVPIPGDMIYTGMPEGPQLQEISHNEERLPSPRKKNLTVPKTREDSGLGPPRRYRSTRTTRAQVVEPAPIEIFEDEAAAGRQLGGTVKRVKATAQQNTISKASLPPTLAAASAIAATNSSTTSGSQTTTNLASTAPTVHKSTKASEMPPPRLPSDTMTAAKSLTMRSTSTGTRQTTASDIKTLPSSKAVGIKCNSDISGPILPGSEPDAVLKRLAIFRDNLKSALAGKTSSSRKRKAESPALPFISRWVDYSRKHGVGYVLQDGTVGFIAVATVAGGEPWPVTHVFARNGEAWLRRVGKRFENLEKVPIRLYRDTEDGIAQIRTLGMSQESTDRIKTLRGLWVKFGRYMSQALNERGDEAELQSGGVPNIVRFYQRLGHVGIWVFNDGCIQIHFPDHTKMVLSADGLHISATMVAAEGVKHVQEFNELPAAMLREREIRIDTTEAFVRAAKSQSNDDPLTELVQANQLQRKLEFLLEIVTGWTNGGGLGLGDEKLQWTGPWVSDHAKKMDWVTVGRFGGDS
ncbi:Serine/threonine-protein kinase plo1-like protein [Elsinoe fawcettii]|nr:Serine/threonine-protein kinase plo1-like protein [Elsinoe fawcettii]